MTMAAKFDRDTASLEDVKARIDELNAELASLRQLRNLKLADVATTKSRMYTAEEVLSMRERHAAGESYKALWLAFGERGTPGLIHDICAFKAYRDVR
jgi:hypothetical protein